MAPLHARIDFLLSLLKWPVAAVAMLALPGTLVSLFALSKDILNHLAPSLSFLAGAAAYLAIWWFFLRSPRFGTAVSTFEHELTHALFAWLTFHKVTAFKVTWNKGGHMTMRGKGNWLIVISPYFFPTFWIILAILFSFTPVGLLIWGNPLLGAAFAYHLTCLTHQIHANQKDFHLVGFPFIFLFLPAANLIVVGMVLSFSQAGLEGAIHFFGNVVSSTWRIMEQLVS